MAIFTFKTLMHCGEFVSMTMLDKGIYSSNQPSIFELTETIETLEARINQMRDMSGVAFFSGDYLHNLRQCQLVKIEIKLIKE